MSKKKLTYRYISDFCYELSLLVRAGISVADGLDALCEDFKDSSGFLRSVADSTESGDTLCKAVEKTGMAPDHLVQTIRLGEASGRLEATLRSLATHYDNRDMLSQSLRSAVVYPLILILMLAAVVVVLITQVLPIFSQVFEQVGAEMSAFARGLMAFGAMLSSASVTIIWILAAIAALIILILLIPPLKTAVLAFFRRYFGAKGIAADALTAQFASAMNAAIASGLSTEESVEMAGNVIAGVKKTDAGIAECERLIAEGRPIEQCLAATGLFSKRDSRLIALGARTGSAEAVMAEIAQRSERRALENVDAAVGRVEPALVVIISVVVGAVLLSVMLPLMGIMSSLG